MEKYVDELRFNIETVEEVFEAFDVVPVFDYEVIPNKFGGNPELKVTFTYKAKNYDGKVKEWIINPAFYTVERFINEIKAYMFMCVYTFVSIF